MQFRRSSAFAALNLALLATLTGMIAAQAGGSAPAQGQSAAPAVETAGQSKEFMNIQILKDIPANQLFPSMQFISASLGVDCSFCHVIEKEHRDFAADDKRNKKTAREMMTMTMAINKESFAGQQRITCATCHQGHNQPNPVAPVLDMARWQERADAEARQAQLRQQQAAAPAANGQQPAEPPRPTPQAMQAAAEEVIAKYTQAIGGEAAIQKLSSLQEKGTMTTPHGDSVSFELQEKAPDKVLMIRTPANGQPMSVVYDGTNAAVVMGGQASPVHAFELEALKLDANFFRNMNIKPQYTRMTSPPFTQKIEGQEVKSVRGLLPNNQGQETLYFDTQSGLLVRRVTVLRTALGGVSQQYDYSDYRAVDGVKIPFTVKVSSAENIQTRKIGEAKFNVPVSDSAFAPAAKAGAPSGN